MKLCNSDNHFTTASLIIISVKECCQRSPDVVVCTCNPATLEAELRKGVDSIPVGGNSHSIGGWIV